MLFSACFGYAAQARHDLVPARRVRERAIEMSVTGKWKTMAATKRHAAARAHAELADASWTTTGVSGGAHEEGIGRLHWRGDGANEQNGGDHFRRR